ncbi:PadR family transcriptional regulator [Amycolatopsis magusensis]|uniref:PadR family transcriptional regulator n=1 Tax=Amycolatopsis magusensis TaxID=882444 RepID=UPI0037AEAC32
MRRTQSLIKVGTELLRRPDARHYGYALSRASGVRSGVMYPILRRLHEAAWIADGWANPDTIDARRPPRRYYVLTPEGRDLLHALIAVSPTS